MSLLPELCPRYPKRRKQYIASVRAHGVRRLLVYCRGKREGDWPCHHEATLLVDRFADDEALVDIERRCRCTACGWRRADLRPDYGAQQAARQSAGWMMPPSPKY